MKSSRSLTKRKPQPGSREKAKKATRGFESEDDWFEYRLEHDSRFLSQISEVRAALRRGEGTWLEDIKEAEEKAGSR